ncbi:PfkB family carbohydrate kinase [Nocardia sp. X0981]
METGLFVGLSTVDIAYRVGSYPAEDTKTQATDQWLGAGGPAANAAVAFTALGGSSTLVTVVGRHQLTDLIRSDLTGHGVEVVDALPDSEHRPPVSSIVVSDSAATRTIVSLDGSRISVRSDPATTALLAGVDVLLADGHHPALAEGLCAAARERGIPIVLDAGRWRDAHTRILPLVDIAICSSSFVPPGIRPGDTAAVLDFLRSAGIADVAVTGGDKPIIGRTGSRSFDIAVSAVPAVDTLGAGDVLHGAFCYYLSAGHDFPGALARASEVATLSCRYFGTREWCAHLSDRSGRDTGRPGGTGRDRPA